jgi:hypothetical protein
MPGTIKHAELVKSEGRLEKFLKDEETRCMDPYNNPNLLEKHG